MNPSRSPLVSCAWLDDHLSDDGLRLLDLRWGDKRDAYMSGHIPGALFVSAAEQLTDRDHPVPDMLAGPAEFAVAMRALGVSTGTSVVVYDDVGVPMLAARLWWALSYYGHASVRVLDGGLREWKAQGRRLSAEVQSLPPGNFEARPCPALLATKQDVLETVGTAGTVLVDCLNSDLYTGLGEKHKWGPRKGHIPHAVNVPFVANSDPSLATATQDEERQFLTAPNKTGLLASSAELANLYWRAGVSSEDRVVTYCGRGYAAAVAALALRVAGHENVAVYDGSWSEWSADEQLPVEVGPR